MSTWKSKLQTTWVNGQYVKKLIYFPYLATPWVLLQWTKCKFCFCLPSGKVFVEYLCVDWCFFDSVIHCCYNINATLQSQSYSMLY